MPLYLINAVGLSGSGPFTDRTGVAEAAQDSDVTDGESLVLNIDENGNIVEIVDAAEFLETED